MTQSSDATARIDELEIRIAHHERAIEDLNATITAQWKDIDRLKRELERLADRLATAENAIDSNPADEPPPPHW